MLGAHSGVAASLKELVPLLIMTHCAAHRLSLPAFDTAHKFPWFSKFENTLNQLYTHFSRSSVCSATLEAVQKVLDAPQLKGIFPHRQFPLCQFLLRQFPFGQLPTLSIAPDFTPKIHCSTRIRRPPNRYQPGLHNP